MSKKSAPPLPFNMILDSGAYSCWQKNESIDVDEYIEFCHTYRESLLAIVNLDTIPGTPGIPPSDAQVEFSAKQSFSTLEYMRSKGIDAMPVFHQGEDFKWLDRMLDAGYDYIGISPDNGKKVGPRNKWLDSVFSYMCGKEGYPSVKCHGFGITTVKSIQGYPWYSVDSVGWLRFGGYGTILVPRMLPDGSGRDYSSKPYQISVSNRLSAGRTTDHIDTVGPELRQHVLDFIAEEDFDIKELAESFKLRNQLCARYFYWLEKYFTVQPFKRPRSLMAPTPRVGSVSHPGRFRMYFSYPPQQEFNETLNWEGLDNRLIAFYYFAKGAKLDFSDYLRTGNFVKPSKG